MSGEEKAMQEGGAEEKAPAGFSPITSQEEMDRRIGERLQRAKKQWADENKEAFEKAKAYDEWQEQNKSELEKERDRADALQQELDERRQADLIAGWKRQVSEETGVPADVLRGTTEEEIREHAGSLKPHFEASHSGFVGSDGFAASKKAEKSTAAQFASALDGII